MKKKRFIGCAVAAAIAASTFAGCSLVSANTKADLAQTIAEVNISKVEKFSDSGLENYKEAVGTTTIAKRELVAYFLNAGYSYVQSGMSYSQVFTSLMNSLVDNAVITQYSIMYVLKDKDEKTPSENALEVYMSKDTEAEKLEYLLGGVHSDDVKIAKYSLYSALNTAIDSYEERYIDSDEETAGTGTRAIPTGVDAENEDYFPAQGGVLNYNVYTGYAGRDKTGAYDYTIYTSGAYRDDMLEGSTKSTRTRAYLDFISTLINNGLVDPVTENINNVLGLAYMQDQYVSQLEQRVIEQYYNLYEEEQEKLLSEGKNDEAYNYVKAYYEDLYKSQSDSLDEASDFTSAMGNMSDSSFILYSPKSDLGSDNKAVLGGTYGFVYNILLPFSAEQNAALTGYQNNNQWYEEVDGTKNYNAGYYTARNELLRNIVTTDQRTAWFNGETDYAFEATAGLNYFNGGDSKRDYLFFENNLTNTERYDSLEKYIGEYSFNGTVAKRADGKGYNIVYNTLDIDGMLAEFSAYIDYVLGGSASNVSLTENKTNFYALTEDNLYKDNTAANKEIDYSNFLYAYGKVDFGTNNSELYNRENYLNKESAQYRAMSAVNELQYAYTTDTGVLSNYIGYSVALGAETGYIKEFEYACHQAIQRGAGSFAVCAGDYGWHLLYVTYTFDNTVGGEQYAPEWTAERIETEGTFENLFYEWVKSTSMEDASSTRRNWIVNKYNKDSTVTRFEKRYQDLLEIDA